MSMKSILIIGCGKLGSSLYRALKVSNTYRIRITDQNPVAADMLEDPVDFITTYSAEMIRATDIIFITVPDKAIPRVVTKLSRFSLRQTIVVHTSGNTPVSLLNPLRSAGALSGSLHPLQTFSQPLLPPETWHSVFCTFSGAPEAENVLRTLCKTVQAKLVPVSSRQKQTLHCAAVFAANYSVALFAAAETLLRREGLDTQLLQPLIRQVQRNFTGQSAFDILSGPLQRGDLQTIEAHLQLLDQPAFKAEYDLYVAMARYLLSKKEFRPEQAGQISALLSKKDLS